ncbi:hypothetical protein BDK51DRAFT_38236 [Blyttiomyces helicus]|uniref:Uncharacterized protein n=1 Tax=Blyttiomyces helicus TaxID=388810 RepID=A0A4P9VZZ4_9FUNG|nr:hypothetical protein BDK51DRAFT_38236 [Blyttiomyces helicus]|eukprot:RKO84383.1 hypothetical protein BDK51DRAFT_38236 [Blyttiomyces helicus]
MFCTPRETLAFIDNLEIMGRRRAPAWSVVSIKSCQLGLALCTTFPLSGSTTDVAPSWSSKEKKVRALFDLSAASLQTFYEDSDGDLDTDEELTDILASHKGAGAQPVRPTIRADSAGPRAPLEAEGWQRIDAERVSVSTDSYLTGSEPVAYPLPTDTDPRLDVAFEAPTSPVEATDPAFTAGEPNAVPEDNSAEFFESLHEFFNHPVVVTVGAIVTELYVAIAASLTTYFRTLYSMDESNASPAARANQRAVARQRMREAVTQARAQAKEFVRKAKEQGKSSWSLGPFIIGVSSDESRRKEKQGRSGKAGRISDKMRVRLADDWRCSCGGGYARRISRLPHAPDAPDAPDPSDPSDTP